MATTRRRRGLSVSEATTGASVATRASSRVTRPTASGGRGGSRAMSAGVDEEEADDAKGFAVEQAPDSETDALMAVQEDGGAETHQDERLSTPRPSRGSELGTPLTVRPAERLRASQATRDAQALEESRGVGQQQQDEQAPSQSSLAEEGGSDASTRPMFRHMRLRQSLFGDGDRLHLMTLEQRLAVMQQQARDVTNFYLTESDGAVESQSEEGTDKLKGMGEEAQRLWKPFAEFKRNRLFASSEFDQHFIFVSEILDALRADPTFSPSKLNLTPIREANIATFLHYVFQAYRFAAEDADGAQEVPRPVDVKALDEARTVFFELIVPSEAEINEGVLSLLIDLNTQVFIHSAIQRAAACMKESSESDGAHLLRLTAGHRESMDDMTALFSVSSLMEQLNKSGRTGEEGGLSEDRIAEKLRTYERLARYRMDDLRVMDYEYITMMERYPLFVVACRLASFIRELPLHPCERPRTPSQPPPGQSHSAVRPMQRSSGGGVGGGALEHADDGGESLVESSQENEGEHHFRPEEMARFNAEILAGNLEPDANQSAQLLGTSEQHIAALLASSGFSQATSLDDVGSSQQTESDSVVGMAPETAMAALRNRSTGKSISGIVLGSPVTPEVQTHLSPEQQLAQLEGRLQFTPGYRLQISNVQRPGVGAFQPTEEGEQLQEFDSQQDGVEPEEDVFLQGDRQDGKRKGKGKAKQTRGRVLAERQNVDEPGLARGSGRPGVDQPMSAGDSLASQGGMSELDGNDPRDLEWQPYDESATYRSEAFPSTSPASEQPGQPQIDPQLEMGDNAGRNGVHHNIQSNEAVGRNVAQVINHIVGSAHRGYSTPPRSRKRSRADRGEEESESGDVTELDEQTREWLNAGKRRRADEQAGKDMVEPVKKQRTEVSQLPQQGEAEEAGASQAQSGAGGAVVATEKKSRSYATGGNQTGRKGWTQEETDALLDALERLLPGERRPKQPYSEVLDLYGEFAGSGNPILKYKNNVQLKDKARNEYQKRLRAGEPIPSYFLKLFNTVQKGRGPDAELKASTGRPRQSRQGGSSRAQQHQQHHEQGHYDQHAHLQQHQHEQHVAEQAGGQAGGAPMQAHQPSFAGLSAAAAQPFTLTAAQQQQIDTSSFLPLLAAMSRHVMQLQQAQQQQAHQHHQQEQPVHEQQQGHEQAAAEEQAQQHEQTQLEQAQLEQVQHEQQQAQQLDTRREDEKQEQVEGQEQEQEQEHNEHEHPVVHAAGDPGVTA